MEGLLQSLPDGVLVADRECFLHANTTALRMLGAESLDVLNGQFQDLLVALDARWRASGQRVTPQNTPLRRALKGESTVDELSVRSLKGQALIVRLSIAPVWLEGEVAAALGILTDVTAERQAEEALRASEARFRSLAVATSEMVWVVGANGEPTTPFSPNYCGFTGLSEEACARWGWLDVVHPDDRDVLRQCWGDATAKPVPFRAEYRLRRADGVYRNMLARGVPVLNAHGAVQEWIGIMVDITEKKQAELLFRQKAEFEQQMIGIVSHDLGNPLAVITMSAERTLQLSRGGNALVDEGLTRILSAARRAQRMMRDLLDFTRARLGGGLPVRRGLMELEVLAEEIVAELSLNHPERQIQVQCEGDTVGQWDADRLAQMVTNLLGNALRYSPRFTPVTVRVRGEEEAVTLEVENQGSPIPETLLPHLFEPLKRGAHRPDQQGSGLGLGLYIVRQIVLAHGGSVELSSSPSRTCCRVSLPRT